MKLSVALITYNHEKYIREALDSILMQITDFDFEIIIGDDFSTDTTPNICCEYASKYPNVKYESYKPNGGISSNWIKTISRCKGDYIALLEGDDFWTSSDKLQMQVDFLDTNKQYVFCYHGFDIKYQDNSRVYNNFRNKLNAEKKQIKFQDSMQICYTQTLTVVFRKGSYNLHLLEGLSVCDRYFYQLLLLNSSGFYLDNIMGSYRIHSSQVTFVQKKSDKSKFIDNIVFWERLLYLEISRPQRDILYLSLTKSYFNIYVHHSEGIFNNYLKRGLLFYIKSFWSKENVKNRVTLLAILLFIKEKNIK
ncbi:MULTISPECIES: glycosyltransferase family 2 protein [Flavobacterium]|uniref:Glycosyltransferase family 2 protein n=1 Tax=Flavobacterium jumunjinense TaxID=998845 RepID=A0ABV5GJ54_9FLAO|nr:MULTISPECIES: glycosyltransferase [Flavobacterium]